MPHDVLPPCSVLILAGGRGTRLGGQDKGLVNWHGRPLIEWLYSVARPITDDLIVSCNRNHDRYRQYADQLVSDRQPTFDGPLAGILAGLAAARHSRLIVLPCDCPKVDLELITGLRKRQLENPGHPLMARQGGQWQPLISALPKTQLEALEQAWAAGERSPREALLGLGARALDLDAADSRTSNLNTPLLLDSAPVNTQPCGAKKNDR